MLPALQAKGNLVEASSAGECGGETTNPWRSPEKSDSGRGWEDGAAVSLLGRLRPDKRNSSVVQVDQKTWDAPRKGASGNIGKGPWEGTGGSTEEPRKGSGAGWAVSRSAEGAKEPAGNKEARMHLPWGLAPSTVLAKQVPPLWDQGPRARGMGGPTWIAVGNGGSLELSTVSLLGIRWAGGVPSPGSRLMPLCAPGLSPPLLLAH